VGELSEFSSLTEPGMRTLHIEQVDGWRTNVSEKVVYVTKDGQGRFVFSVRSVLTSVVQPLGTSKRNKFVCPCHDTIFAADGTRVSGPSLRGMGALETSVGNGQLQVRFQYFRQLVSHKEVIG
jgi:hypothetical protein